MILPFKVIGRWSNLNEIIKKEFERIKFECRPNRDIEIGYFDVFDIFFGNSPKININSNFIGGVNDKRNTLHENMFHALYPYLTPQVHFGTGKGGLEKYLSKRYTADFYSEEGNVIYEIDGSNHKTELQQSKDRLRDLFFEIELGIKTIRLTNKEVEGLVLYRLKKVYEEGGLNVWNRKDGTRIWLFISR